MIVEMRTYTVKPQRTHDFLALYERAALPIQKKHLGNLVGFFVSEIGDLNQVVHLWGYESLGERERRRAEMMNDPGWPIYLSELKALDAISEQKSQILRSTSFSPV